MRSKIIMSIIAGSFALIGAAAANDTMDAMIGNSVTYSYADGSEVTVYFNADGTYETDSAGSGSWSINGDEICIETEGGDSGCTTLDSGYGSGDSWDSVDAFGNDVTITIG